MFWFIRKQRLKSKKKRKFEMKMAENLKPRNFFQIIDETLKQKTISLKFKVNVNEIFNHFLFFFFASHSCVIILFSFFFVEP
jgi:hypothetical protein